LALQAFTFFDFFGDLSSQNGSKGDRGPAEIFNLSGLICSFLGLLKLLLLQLLEDNFSDEFDRRIWISKLGFFNQLLDALLFFNPLLLFLF